MPEEKIKKEPVEKVAKEPMIPVSDVKKLIADAIANANTSKPLNPKRATEHTAHLWRLDGKWVVDFKDRNTDPYVKKAIYAYEKFNAERREFESWVELIFQDGTTKDISLKNYVSNRIPIYCTILKKEKVDKSYSVGEVEKKNWVGDKLVGTGTMINQMVEVYEEKVTVKTPDGEEITIPDYVI